MGRVVTLRPRDGSGNRNIGSRESGLPWRPRPWQGALFLSSHWHANLPATPIVMVAASDGDGILFLAPESGADGCLLKRTKPMEMRAALLDVMSGGAP
jgi:CheY-like chemotaxis protein